MNEQSYERAVEALEKRYAKTIAAEAAYGLRAAHDIRAEGDEAHTLATEHVAHQLLGDPAWESVEAVDISDIAYEAVSKAEREPAE